MNMNKKKDNYKPNYNIFMITLVLVTALMIVVYIRTTQSMRRCDKAIDIWYNATGQYDNKPFGNYQKVNYETICKMYCVLPK